MIYLTPKHPILLLSLLFVFSCENSNYKINYHLIKNTFIDSNLIKTEDIKNDLHAKVSIDTLKCNQNLNYTQALFGLKKYI